MMIRSRCLSLGSLSLEISCWRDTRLNLAIIQSFAQIFVWRFEIHLLRIEMRFSSVRPVTRCSEAIELEISALEQDPIILPPAILFTTQDFDINLKF